MNTYDVLRYGHQTVERAVAGLDKSDWQAAGVTGVWSVKDVIAHLASFEQVLVEILESLLSPGPTPTVERFKQGQQRFNDYEVNRRRQLTVREVWDEYERGHLRTLELLAQIPCQQLQENGALPWYGPAYDLEDFMVYTFYGHKREHSAQIAIYRDRLQRAMAAMV